VADEGRSDNRAQGRAGAGARTWPIDRARRAWQWAWPHAEFAVPARIRDWAAAEVGAGRLLPWLAVAYGFGIVLYFTAEHEPAWWAALPLATGAVAAAVTLRGHVIAFSVALSLSAIAAGFAVATIKTALIAHPVLRLPASGVTITGVVELREESQHTDRFVLRVERMDGKRIEEAPWRVRLSVKRGMAPPAGTFVEVKALLDPPLQPLEPGAYDFARDLYFQRIGASGFVRGAIKVVSPPASAGLMSQLNAVLQNLRDAIDARIRAVVPGDPGAIASMLITGKRDAIASSLYDALFVSGIGHVLSISGYHMAVVAGVIFFAIRALLALIPGLPDRAPIKKWAALAALAVTAFYLVLSGAEVATQRSFIMIAVVLLGVLADRPTLTLRTLTLAALIVLVLAPEAVVHPSFQMSFAATLALIATYGRGLTLRGAATGSSIGARAALWGVNEVVGLTVASLVAGLATTPYAAYHFHRAAPFGLLANLLAMPVVSAWVMPMAILGVVAIPFGFDAECWRQMEYGIEWMDAVAVRVASLPGAFGRVTEFGAGPLLVATAGLLLVGLLKTPLRWAGLAFAALAVVWAVRTPQPDVLIADDGRTFAVRGADHRLAFHHLGGDTFAMREWLAADADGRDVRAQGLGGDIACDPSGCIGRLGDGSLVAYVIAPDAFAEDCRRAVLVIAAREPPPDCAAAVVARSFWRDHGALALRREGAGFVIEAARPGGFDRPWAPAPGSPRGATAMSAAGSPDAAGSPPKDATPRPEDIEADQ
jgi:competence protein ComEC